MFRVISVSYKEWHLGKYPFLEVFPAFASCADLLLINSYARTLYEAPRLVSVSKQCDDRKCLN